MVTLHDKHPVGSGNNGKCQNLCHCAFYMSFYTTIYRCCTVEGTRMTGAHICMLIVQAKLTNIRGIVLYSIHGHRTAYLFVLAKIKSGNNMVTKLLNLNQSCIYAYLCIYLFIYKYVVYINCTVIRCCVSLVYRPQKGWLQA